MINVNDFKTGVTITLEGAIYQVLEFQHVKPGKGAAIVKAKLKNLRTGSIVENTFNAGIKVETAHIDKQKMQFLYSDGDKYNFMDMETFELIPISEETVGDSLKFVKENDICKILSFKGNVFGIEPPIFVELEVIDTEPGFKGDTATGASKPAVVETGATVKVPLFVNKGDRIRIDTRTQEYMERA